MKMLALLLGPVLCLLNCGSAQSPVQSDAPESKPTPGTITVVSSKEKSRVADLRGRSLEEAQAVAGVDSLNVRPSERNLRQHSEAIIGKGDFVLRATVVVDEFNGRGAAVAFDGGTISLDDREWGAVLSGRLFGGGRFPFETDRPASARPGAPLEVEVFRVDGELIVRLNEFEMGRIGMKGFALGRVGFDLAAGGMRVLECSVEGDCSEAPRPRAVFSSADGDIDEYRDPSIAADGTRAIVSAIAVQTADTGATINSLWLRGVSSDGSMGDVRKVDLGETSPELALLGCAPGAPRPWKLLVQETGPNRLAERLIAFESADGSTFSRSATIDSTGAPLQLMPGGLHAEGSGLVAGATRVRGGQPRATAIRLGADGAWRIDELVDDPSCEPLWLGQQKILWRTPRSPDRGYFFAGERGAVAGLDGGATSFGVLRADDARVAVALAEASFPYPLQQFDSADGGKTWSRGRVVWGGSSGHAQAIAVGAKRFLLFEGGDRARREHVLLLEARADVNAEGHAADSPTANSPSTR